MPRLDLCAPRLAGLAAGVLLCVVLLGCMSISLGGKNVTCQSLEEPFEQKGELCLGGVGGQNEIDVYYPIPYAGPPNLQVDAPGHRIAVLEQKPDHFRVYGVGKMKWVAKGVRVGPSVVVSVPPGPPPPAALPGPPLLPAPPEPRP